jgi:hypothetical protein
MSMLKNWSVTSCSNCGTHNVCYGDDYEEDWNCDYCGYGSPLLLDKDAVDCEDIVNIIESELENANWHSMMDYPRKVLDILKKHAEDEENESSFKSTFIDLMESLYEMI